MEIVDLLKTVRVSSNIVKWIWVNKFLQQTPIKGPIHNYDPHNFDDMYADEYGGYGSGMSNGGGFRNGGGGGGGGGGGRGFGSDRGGLFFEHHLLVSIFSLSNFPAASGGSRFSDRGGSRGGFNDRRGGGNMDRGGRGGGGGGGNGAGMRDYVDPWAHNGNGNGSSPMMGGSGPLNNFSLGNGNTNGLNSINMGNSAPNNNGNNGGGGGFGGSNAMDMDKTSTQVTIPKDVSFDGCFVPRAEI